MSLRNTVEFTHMTLRLVPEVLYSVDMSLIVCKEFGMVDPEVMEIRYIQNVVTFPTVRIDYAVRHHLAFDDRHQSRRRGISDNLRVDLATTLQQAEYRYFFPAAPRPRLPLRLPPKQLSSTSISPPNMASFSASSSTANNFAQLQKVAGCCFPVSHHIVSLQLGLLYLQQNALLSGLA